MNDEILKTLESVLQGSQSTTQGTMTQQFENHFKHWFSMKHGIAFNSGTSTLHAILLALGIGKGDEVIIPSLGPIMDTFAVLQCGAKPVFADSDNNYCIDPIDIATKITNNTKAIIVVHLYGGAANMLDIMSVAKDIPVIEDCAQAIFTYTNAGLAGTIGIASSFSFEASKHLSTGEGGMVLTNNIELATKIRKYGGLGFANLGADDGLVRRNEDIFKSHDYKRHDTIGYNYRMSEFTATIGLIRSQYLDSIVNERITQGMAYIEQFNPLIDKGIVKIQNSDGNSYYTFAMEFDKESNLDIFTSRFKEKYYACWSVPYLEPIGVMGNCPNSESMQRRIIQLKTSYKNLETIRSMRI